MLRNTHPYTPIHRVRLNYDILSIFLYRVVVVYVVL